MIIGTTENPIDPGDGSIIRELLGKREILGSCQTLSLSRVAAKAGHRGKCHYHKTFDELYYILHGHVCLTVDGVTHRLKEGQCILIRRGERHSIRVPDKAAEFIAVCTPAWDENDQLDCE